jgi:hypothetical protein
MSSVCKKCHINLVEQQYTQFKMCEDCLKKLSEAQFEWEYGIFECSSGRQRLVWITTIEYQFQSFIDHFSMNHNSTISHLSISSVIMTQKDLCGLSSLFLSNHWLKKVQKCSVQIKWNCSKQHFVTMYFENLKFKIELSNQFPSKVPFKSPTLPNFKLQLKHFIFHFCSSG